jgi:hypothetical protein
MNRPPPRPPSCGTVPSIRPVAVMPGERMLRAAWRWPLALAAFAVLHGSAARAPMASVVPTSNTLVRAMPDAAIGAEMAAVSGNPIAEIPLDRLSATRNRPLFSPSRRPPAPPPPAAIATRVERAPQPLPLSPPGVALFGIVVGAQGARAFIATGAADRIIGVRPGDVVSGWTVTEITKRNLVLSHAERSATFTLFSPDNVSQTRRSDAATSNLQAARSSDPPRGRVRIR